MSMTNLLSFTPWPTMSAAILLALLVTALYLARGTAHQAIQAAAGALSRGLRVAAHSVTRAQEHLAARNREVLLAAGRESKERLVEREFARVGDTVRKDLAGYPDMHRRLSEAIQRIEEDQEKAVEVPPEAPGWAQAVKVVADLDTRNAGADILADIHKSMVKAHEEAMDDYRKASGERHALLRRMMPDWRQIQDTLGRVHKSTAGTAVNFTLIARPMAEMVGGTNFVGAYRTADIAALVIIMVEISMGLFLMESLRITRLFPVIGALSDKMRVRMMFMTFSILLMMASIEAGLAYMREVLLQDELATSALLRGDNSSALVNSHLWITTAAQMGMGFVLPFALVFVAIPLETFVHSLRTVVGLLGIALLQTLALLLRLLGNGCRHLGTLAQQLYDLPLFVPLWIETRMHLAAAQRPVAVVGRRGVKEAQT